MSAFKGSISVPITYDYVNFDLLEKLVPNVYTKVIVTGMNGLRHIMVYGSPESLFVCEHPGG